MRFRRFAVGLVCCTLLGGSLRADELVEAAADAVGKSLPLLEASAAKYVVQRQCFSCHHQALPAIVFDAARKRGQTIDALRARAQSDFTIAYYQARKERLLEGSGVPGRAYSAGYALLSLAADDWTADDTTAALATYLLKTQESDGRWRIGTRRPPLEESDFTSTALAVRGLQRFAADAQRDEVNSRTAAALAWLQKTAAASGEDRTFRLLGLHWAGAEPDDVREAAQAILSAQREDGGWSQTADMESDPYATGQALAALRLAGETPADHEAYRRGARYLVNAQRDDGSWLVATRSRPIQTYFESGYPHGKSQFISISAASWATLALIELLPET